MNHLRRGQKIPKRIEIVSKMLTYLIKDYLTIIGCMILIITVWRSINTLEIIYDCITDSFDNANFKNHIKNQSFQMRIWKEIKRLIRDFFLIFILILSFLLIHRSKNLLLRLSRVIRMRKERREIQTINYLKKVIMFNRTQKIEDNVDVKKKNIKDLNKNIMSILLPYLKHDEILKFEACSTKTALFANHWPVWKNIYSD